MSNPKYNEEKPDAGKFCSKYKNKIQFAKLESVHLNTNKSLNNKKKHRNAPLILMIIALGICIFFTSYFNKVQSIEDIIAPKFGKIKVPNVRDMCLADAKMEIKDDKLIVGKITEQFDDKSPVGNIISQQPSEGDTVNENAFINLVVSKGAKTSPEESVKKIK
jgi:hypothetical protein